MDTGDKRGYDTREFAQPQGRAVGDGWGLHVKQPVKGWSRINLCSRIALAAVLTGVLGLAACGRKGPLDPPPSAGLTPTTAYTPRPGLGEEHYGTPPGTPTTPPLPAAAPAPSPEPQQKTFFLDFLLGK